MKIRLSTELMIYDCEEQSLRKRQKFVAVEKNRNISAKEICDTIISQYKDRF